MNKLKLICVLSLVYLLLIGLSMISDADASAVYGYSEKPINKKAKCYSNVRFKYCDFKNNSDVFVSVRDNDGEQ